MKVVLFGASGMVGSRIAQELSARGHEVIAVTRHPERVKPLQGVTAVAGDMTDPGQVTQVLQGADAAVSAYKPGPGEERKAPEATKSLLEGAWMAGVQRVLVVGGAASLYVAPGMMLLDSGHLPEEWKPIAAAYRDVLEMMRTLDIAKRLEWTYFSPAAFIQPGKRTGTFRLGRDELVTDAQGESRISAEDAAIAIVDELENPQHIRQRFTAAY